MVSAGTLRGAAVKLRLLSFCASLCLRRSITNTVSAVCFHGTLEVSFIYYFCLFLNLRYIDFKLERVECNMTNVDTHAQEMGNITLLVIIWSTNAVITVFILPQSQDKVSAGAQKYFIQKNFLKNVNVFICSYRYSWCV